ncbi:phospho-2-dehydro-3-deoxyheptonate aldolase AroF [Clostridium aceticum]|uniref:Phospho-2-dehydro-3-deoxyheptonate aldolase AroF n=1 Tax=Clostridium aceticum TaxID=84022 RepID=A0A0G3W944_9CLOT|nr:3-deoxy-7-phosphoheptulonate synthase [Clostridium aceticum]AKL94432.1 phospho-2-dehydro-3-deoxyheptonate aldolase AroF [Clostridium aceticum]
MADKKILTGEKRTVQVGKIKFGEDHPPVYIAGPCAVESKQQIMETAAALKEIGVDVLRGGVFKPRTSPYAFQGLGREGLEYLKEAAEVVGLPIITELMDESHMEVVSEYADIIQVGSRNMFNYSLLKSLGNVNKPIFLKRGMCATINEWIMAAEYIAAHGNQDIILCERGIRGFDNYTRNTLDLAAVPIMQKETGLPVVVDPSHATGIRELIAPMSKAALACGANGLMIEVHPNPSCALSDGPQSLNFQEYQQLRQSL